jgi:hypothetical protein
MQLVIYVDVYGVHDNGEASARMVSKVLHDIATAMSYGASIAEVAQQTYASEDGQVEATLEWIQRMTDEEMDDLYNELGGT